MPVANKFADEQFEVKVLPARVLEPWGQRVILFCYIRSNDDYKVVWLHNNKPMGVLRSKISIINTYRGSTLDIPFLDLLEVGTYTCRVTANNLTLQDIGEVVMIGKVNAMKYIMAHVFTGFCLIVFSFTCSVVGSSSMMGRESSEKYIYFSFSIFIVLFFSV